MRLDLYTRLDNWKFKDAEGLLQGDEPENVRNLIVALSHVFGNVGWGIYGGMHVILNAAVNSILPEEAPKE